MFFRNWKLEIGNSQRGYLLVESIIATTIVVVGLLGIFSLLSQSLSLNRVTADRYIASYLAGEGIELIKNFIDGNVLAGAAFNEGLGQTAGQQFFQIDRSTTLPLSPCGSQISDCPKIFSFNETEREKTYSYNPGQPTKFNRVIVIEPITDSTGLTQALKVSSIVNWSSRGGAHFTVNVEDHFYNYR